MMAQLERNPAALIDATSGTVEIGEANVDSAYPRLQAV